MPILICKIFNMFFNLKIMFFKIKYTIEDSNNNVKNYETKTELYVYKNTKFCKLCYAPHQQKNKKIICKLTLFTFFFFWQNTLFLYTYWELSFFAFVYNKLLFHCQIYLFLKQPFTNKLPNTNSKKQALIAKPVNITKDQQNFTPVVWMNFYNFQIPELDK